MSKKFNVTGTCFSKKHYMVDTSEKLAQIKEMIDAGAYFTINRGRQYGKTTTLSRLFQLLQNEYTVARISFQHLGDTNFSSEKKFLQDFFRNRI